MKKIYNTLECEILFFYAEDVITASVDEESDNVGELPEFPEFIG